MPPRAEELSEPLLSSSKKDDVEAAGGNNTNEENENGNTEVIASDDNENESNDDFSYKHELGEMFQLGFPLAVSFFCRMGMASTDSAFVGHIHDGSYTPETYLAAAVLSDMIVGVCITPPLAFNQVLNALVGQSMGSNNPKMAGVWLQQSMFWLSVTMLPCLIGLFYAEPMLLLLGFPANVAHVAGVYSRYNVIWPIPNGLYQCMRFYFQAQGKPRPAMYNNIIFLFVNAFLNWVFVFGGPIPGFHGFGFIGAAISLSFSRTMQSIAYFCYMFLYKKNHKDTWPDAGWSFAHHTRDRTVEFMKQSLPNIGTLLFQCCASQATTVFVGRLGERAIASSSALSTVCIPWSGTLSATTSTISGVRVGYHLGRGNGNAARRTAWLVNHCITIVMVIVAVCFMLPIQKYILSIATDDEGVIGMAKTLIPAMLVGTYLNLLVGNITSGVFGGMGRPIIATILSFGFELPMTVGGVALYILYFHGNLVGVYWWQAIAGGIEVVVVLAIMLSSDWNFYATEARRRQEVSQDDNDDTDQSVDGNDNNNSSSNNGNATSEETSVEQA